MVDENNFDGIRNYELSMAIERPSNGETLKCENTGQPLFEKLVSGTSVLPRLHTSPIPELTA